jgi:hypothetical protein
MSKSYVYLPLETELANIKQSLLSTAEGNDLAMINYLDQKIELETTKIDDNVNTKIQNYTVNSLNNITGPVGITSTGTISVAVSTSQKKITISTGPDKSFKLSTGDIYICITRNCYFLL